MGFVFKSTFWLGVVYYAMPWGELPEFPTSPGAAAWLCSSASASLPDRLGPLPIAYRDAATAGCAAVAASGAADPIVSAADRPERSGSAPRRASTQSLSDADRRIPWFGPRPAPPPNRATKQS
jgi:hypothetical protein